MAEAITIMPTAANSTSTGNSKRAMALAIVVVERQDQRHRGAREHQHLDEARERVGDELAVIGDAVRRW